ncbi:hypothetical protein Pmani_025064 [Petrolisthes manimaculis]|uniref:Uncharacterized protein n=1 Tax=Petrolisthes manimaculis TaxID=1843537 RepID=A0AAE1U1J8_9EUCA|nr:hypothetical protein Pmani_025064 [Petrolisthes manimaculis]
MEDEVVTEELQGKELQKETRKERLINQLKINTDRLLNIAHRAHLTIKYIGPDNSKSIRLRDSLTDSECGGMAGPEIPTSASKEDKKVEELRQEATEHVDQANNIISEILDILNEAGETGLSFEELSLTFTTDRRGWDDGTALGLDIDHIVEKLKRQERHIENLFDKLE